ncbi:MAG: hypothetical protein Q7V00_12540 [Sulfurimicrobium sp.]|nr:hypothetical protein [Sulfurimicrobium sp.]MDO9189691.1 hypothetical protein [Sulfurimicrobium sp.]MDP1705265.1 hypothetical protein [Sulfurimicrobium sp.]MDP2197618.1 hypothetical protein [Sulfurimicrobium sp.]MDP3688922.1 hypothetical protein [Sulfurimicrobium sp.]
MSTEPVRSAHDDVLAKMDALLKRHYDRLETAPAALPAMDFPVLTEVVPVEEEVIPVLTEVVEEEKTEMNEFPFLLLEDVNEEQAPKTAAGDDSLHLSGQSLQNLDRQIHDILDQRLSAHIVSAMDQAMSSMLDQFAMQLESVVREAVAQELQKQLGEIAGRSRDANEAGE